MHAAEHAAFEPMRAQVSGLLANMSDQYGNVTATDGDRTVHDGLRYSIEHASSYQAAPGDGPDEAALMRAELARAKAELAELQAGGKPLNCFFSFA